MTRWLVTSALPYANGPIHFGHVAGAYLPADIYARYLRMRHGRERVLYVCGTDEHGVAITLGAEREGLDYRAYVDRWHAEIKALFDRFGISFDVWSGTARCPYHVDASQRFFTVLRERGYVFERTEEQWYSESAERFLPDRYLQGTCPECGHDKARGDECPNCGSWIDARKLGNPVSLVDGSRPVLKETTHWYLDLPKLKPALLEWYAAQDSERHAPWKPNVDGYVQAMLEGLRERPITRDLPWGVPVPVDGAEGKVLYVWFDAPVGYLSATMEWAAAAPEGESRDWRDWWLQPEGDAPGPRLVHFIGKDNIAFHVVVFPSMLLGQEDAWEAEAGGRRFVLPWAVPANEFYNLQGRKFSTSSGWYLDNAAFFARYSADAARFHLVLSGPETADSEFTWEGFQSTNNALLADKLGNFASRVLKFAVKAFAGRVPDGAGAPELPAETAAALAEADRLFASIGPLLEGHGFRQAAQALIAGCTALNQYFDGCAPWKLAKSEAAADRALCAAVVERCIAYLELLSRRMAPFCPGAADQLRAMLGPQVAPAGAAGDWGADGPPTTLPSGAELGEPGVLFAKIDDADIQAEVARLQAGAKS